MIPSAGHTPGHIAVEISSNRERLLCTGDAVLHPIHLEHPDWHAVVDIIPEKVLTTRQRALRVSVQRLIVTRWSL
jgi:glyoxylase-like metal-dependent hydrolase (beta-lactamase superfamily II)